MRIGTAWKSGIITSITRHHRVAIEEDEEPAVNLHQGGLIQTIV